MSYPSSIFTPVSPTPTTIRHETGGISLATNYVILEAEVLGIETELGLNPKDIDDAVAPGVPTSVANYLDMIGNQLKDIIGGGSWSSNAPVDLTDLLGRFDLITGHDHDGIDSKKVLFSSLLNPPTGLTGGAAHGSSAHTGTIGTWAQIDKATSSIADITTRDHSLLANIGANDHHNQAHSDSDHSGANKYEVRREGLSIGTRPAMNLHEGSNITLVIADDGGDGEVDVTISASGALGLISVQEDDVNVDPVAGTLDFRHGLDVTSAPAGEANIDVDESELDPRLLSNLLRVTDAGGLDVDIAGGFILIDEGINQISPDTLTLADDSNNYVFVDNAGTIDQNTTGFPVHCVPLAIVTTVAGDITDIAESRAFYRTSSLSSVFVGVDDVQTLTQKTLDNTNTVTLKDTLFILQDDGDATRQMQFQLSGIAAGQTRVLTVPDASGTIALTTDLAGYQPLDAQLTSLAGLAYAGNSLKIIRVNVGETAFELATGGGDALTANPLSQFAATTSLQLLGVISDETGSGALVFATSPGFTTAANPVSNDGATLGTSILNWSDLFLADGAVINFNAGGVTLTHSLNTLTLAGGNLALGANDLTMTGSLGATGARLTKGWFTDLQVTNAIAGDITGNAATITAANEASDTTCFPLFVTAVTGSLGGKTNAGLIFNASTGKLQSTLVSAATGFVPDANDGAYLGTTLLQFSDLFLASGAVIDFANGNAVLTHSSGILTVSTGDLRITNPGTNAASAVTVGGTQTLTAKTLTSPLINDTWDGWISANETWTYSNINQFTIAGDKTGKYYKGMLLKYQQDIVVGATYGTDTFTSYVYYKFDTGALTTDSGSGGHALTLISDPAEDTGRFGTSANFDGNDAYSAVDHADFKPASSFTIGCWLNTTSLAATQSIFQSLSQNLNVAGFRLQVDTSGNVTLRSGKNTGTTQGTDFEIVTSTVAIGTGSWYFLVGTWNANTNLLKVYINGRLEGTTIWANAPAYAATNYVRVGCGNITGSNTNFVSGRIDDLFLMRGIPLGDSDIMNLYTQRAAIGTGVTLTAINRVERNPRYDETNTTVTIVGDTNSEIGLVNAAIGNPFYSTSQNPLGKLSSSTRETRYVPVSPAIELVNLDPTDTNFTHTGTITAPTGVNPDQMFAVAIHGIIQSATTAGRRLSVKEEGDSAPASSGNALCYNPNATSASGYGSRIVPIGSHKTFLWGVNSADVSLIIIYLDGVFEYVQ